MPVNFDDVRGSVIFDLDGVVHLGAMPILGASEAIATLLNRSWQILFATNNSTATAPSVAQSLSERTAIAIDPATIITSAMATAAYLGTEHIESAFVVGSRQLRSTLSDGGISIVGPESAEAVVVGLDRSLADDTIERACLAIGRGAVLVATNTDATFPTPDGPVPGAGTTVAAIATASESTFVVCGKPHAPMVELVSSQLASDNIWMVGDRLETDIAFAKRAGWNSVLTLSGVTERGAEIPEELIPDYVVDSIADLPSILAKSTKRPLYER